MFNLIMEKKRILAKKLKENKWVFIVFPVLVLLVSGFFWGQEAIAGTLSVPGSESDPLVTASWVEAKFEALSENLKEEQRKRQVLEERIRQLEAGAGIEVPFEPEQPVVVAPALTYEIVTVDTGKRILSGAGTEFVLRSGRAMAIAGPGGGLSDLTSGQDLSSGETINRDHLILSAREDGRGAVAETDAIFLIRGGYEIK
ncbi:MAG: hypothetical protein GX996_07900 [Firmicutes bacterium]|nr:hypothetical protein [Bacillota bacterium]